MYWHWSEYANMPCETQIPAVGCCAMVNVRALIIKIVLCLMRGVYHTSACFDERGVYHTIMIIIRSPENRGNHDGPQSYVGPGPALVPQQPFSEDISVD